MATSSFLIFTLAAVMLANSIQSKIIGNAGKVDDAAAGVAAGGGGGGGGGQKNDCQVNVLAAIPVLQGTKYPSCQAVPSNSRLVCLGNLLAPVVVVITEFPVSKPYPGVCCVIKAALTDKQWGQLVGAVCA